MSSDLIQALVREGKITEYDARKVTLFLEVNSRVVA